ncbi:golvesin C-terminal-like domain-containing protein [Streptomyces barringtoniae]|uniref:golvesin C-terminal-like domain-containing protein n=1 Tax=Streptomyces barringtoniae TaxID=2892029 RepID=UPI001E381633|nr:Tat pathway signal protein [Streptomyces barringtoniae]MCC5475632.1 Tat pathway signal protein [Streptomyces barringtoniae]
MADATSFKILVAEEADAYQWKTAAALSEPGMPADSWIGNTCVMDRDHVAAVYAPRSFTNKPDLMQGGAFTAIIDTSTGDVTKLPFTGTLAYFDPSCNPQTHTAAFTAFRDMNEPSATRTRVMTVDTAGKTLSASATKGEVTSAVPVKDGVIGALSRHLIHLDHKGKVKDLLTAGGVPFDIQPVNSGDVAFVERNGAKRARARVWSAKGKTSVIASGKLGDLDLTRGGSSSVFLVGHPTGATHTSGSGITRLNAPVNTDVSSLGRLAVNPVLAPGLRAGIDRIKDAGKGFTRTEPASQHTSPAPGMVKTATSLTVTSTATSTGTRLSQQVTLTPPMAEAQLSPALASASKARAAAGIGSGKQPQSARVTAVTSIVSHDPTDPDRWCSVSRNDVKAQALQPTPNQVEWAVDMAVRGDLHAGYLNQGGYRNQAGLGTIDPQGLFPPPTLTGASNARIPVNVMLGIMAQESNLWQAESGSIPGQMGSPLAAVDGYYGHQIDPGNPDSYWNINWDKSDCGYGVGQVTDGMRLKGHEKPGETSLSPALQKLVAIDYATNIAASMKILADKWNEVHKAGQTITVNNDDPSYVENWFTAVWNYNLGFNPPSQASQHGGHWGLGWYNNPANPIYAKGWGHPFMNTDVDGTDANHDAAHPQDWPYEVKVMGWAAWSIDTGYSYATSGRQDWPGESGFSSAGFRPAYWNGADLPVEIKGSARYNRAHVTPDLDVFCNSKNNCDPNTPPNCGTEECYAQYWWNQPNATWKTDCASTCGHENIKYQSLVSEPGRGYRLKNGTPVCSGAPSGAQVVASVPNGTDTYSDCGPVTSSGSFQFTFYADTMGTHFNAKADLHQVGGGYGGHFWYAHERDTNHLGGDGGSMTIDGDWKLNKPMDKTQAMVYVHVPDTGAQTTQAVYEVVTAFGTRKVTVDQSANASNKWVSLGAFRFNDRIPEVRLSNTTSSGSADKDIAWGAVAFVPGNFDVSGGRMAGLELPDPDYNAPDVDFIDNDQQKQPAPTGLVTPSAASSLTSNNQCAKGLKNGQSRQCVTYEPLIKRPSMTRTAGTGALSTTLVPWCAQTGLTQTYTIERREGCLAFTTLVHWTKKDPDGTIETASAAFNIFVETKTQNKATFTERMSIVPVDMDTDLGAVSLDYWQTPCTPNCDATYTTNWTDATWTSLTDKHWASATKSNTWTTPTAGTSEKFDRGVYLSFKADSPKWQGVVPVDKPEISLFDQIRCDNSVTVPNSTGCIFYKHIPTYTVNDRKYPAAAAYYWLLREELPSHPGSEEHKTPLHREIDQRVRDKNRGVVCPNSWKPYDKATPEATTNSPDGRQCDEYPFASTKESGGQFVDSGDKCIQLYAQKSASDGKWRLYYDDRPGVAAPTWQEVCGRASMSAKQNEGAGRDVGSFYKKARVDDNDPFYIKAPDLEGCRPDEVCVVQPH